MNRAEHPLVLSYFGHGDLPGTLTTWPGIIHDLTPGQSSFSRIRLPRGSADRRPGVRGIDALAVYKDAKGEIEVEHLSNLTQEEAIELGSKVGALVGLGIAGEEGAEEGAEAGAQAGEDGIDVFGDAEWDVIEDIPND